MPAPVYDQQRIVTMKPSKKSLTWRQRRVVAKRKTHRRASKRTAPKIPDLETVLLNSLTRGSVKIALSLDDVDALIRVLVRIRKAMRLRIRNGGR